ncbi:hypothetical protein [Nocardia sp. NBC_01009]|uniref:hypothetical protein n=1 Tax=Nocardia sp. NBC_01009 TaxID=2975996 RepID=UPI003870DCF0|nr:hypothetical protein OHA42_17815 [Nocardia sp. NBC_01009]
MIASGKALLAWIEANLPALDEDRFGPWQTGPAVPDAVTADIEVRIQSPGTVDRTTTIALSATPVTDLPHSAPMPRGVAAAQHDSR